MSELLKVAVKGYDGKAKAIASDNYGIVKVEDVSAKYIYPVGKMNKLALLTPDGTNNEAVHFTTANCYIPKGLNGYKHWGAFTPFYKVDDHTNDYTENPCIMASNDGVNWVVPDGVTNPLFGPPSEGYYADTSLVWDGAKLYLFWQHYGSGSSGTISETYRSESIDGVNWSEPTRLYSFHNTSVGEVFFRMNSNCWVAFDRHFTRYYSSDGIHFGNGHKTTSNLDHLIGFTYHVGIFNDGMRFHFLTSKSPYRPSASLANQTYCAVYHGISEDGTHIEYDPNPVWTLDTSTFMTGEIRRAEIGYGDNQDFYLYTFGCDDDKKYYSGITPIRFGDLKSLKQTQSNIVLFDNFELRDTDIHWSQFAETGNFDMFQGALQQIAKYKHKCLRVYNTLDKAITMQFADDYTGQVIKINGEKQEVTLPIYAYDATVIDNISLFNTRLPFFVKPLIKSAEAPTTGQITIELCCWN